MNCKVCENTSAKNTKVSFFRFPKENSRCKVWAERCNLLHLFEKYDSLRFYKSFRICSDHFDPKDIVFDGRKKRLLRAAVPFVIYEMKNCQNVKERSNFNANEEFRVSLCEGLCRFCAEEKKNLTDIFGVKGQTLGLENKLKYFPLKVNKCDTLPLRICNQCILKVNQFCDFIVNCVEAETKLKKLLGHGHCETTYSLKAEDIYFKPEAKNIEKEISNVVKVEANNSSESLMDNCKIFNDVFQANLSGLCISYGNENKINSENLKNNTDFEQCNNEFHISQPFIQEENDVKCLNTNLSIDHSYSNVLFAEQSTTPSETKIPDQTEDHYFNISNKHSCNKCFQTFSNIDVLNSHLVHLPCTNSNGEHVCETWDRKFLDRCHSYDSIEDQDGENTSKCQTCDKKFYKVAFIKQHSLINHLKEVYSNSFLRPSHIYEETKGITSKNCLDCLSVTNKHNQHNESLIRKNRRTSKKSKFFKNNLISSNLKIRCKCRFCDKWFKGYDVCSVHEKTHTGETPYQCKQCAKTFRSRPSLRQHRSVHSDKRHFTCEDCGKSFKRKDTLRNHLRIHTGERPFVCKVCGFAFKQRGDCMKHEKNHGKDTERGLKYASAEFATKE